MISMTQVSVFRHPLAAPLLVGLVLRVVAAWTGYGIFASDDYTHVIEMAWRWLEEPELQYNSRIRSELLARLVWVVFAAIRFFGVRDPTLVLQLLYTVFGLYSLLAIAPTYRLAQARFGDDAARVAAWLTAVEAALPRLSTRALISMASIPPLLWGLVWVERGTRIEVDSRWRALALGGALISVAALFRFQIGLLFLTLVVWMLFKIPRAQRLYSTLVFCAGGLVGLLAQLGLDLHAFGSPTPAPWLYLKYNMEESSRFGVAPWFSYAGMFILLTLPPATIALAPGIWRAARRYSLLSAPFAVFFVFHSAIGHKEERFLFPLIPIFLILMAPALLQSYRAGGWRRGMVRYFWIINAVLLVGASISDAHRNVVAPMVNAGRDPRVTEFYAVGHMLFPRYYLGESTRGSRLNDVPALLERWSEQPPSGTVRILFNRPPSDDELARIRSQATSCGTERWSHSDAVDRLLVWVNPIGNKRRRGPKRVVDCHF